MSKYIHTIAAILIAIVATATAQAEIYTLDEARELYKAGKYEEAAPTFQKELKKKPKNGSLNHWYGVCLHYMGNHQEAIKYLQKGVERKVILSNFYLGEVYAALYRFEEAVDAYDAYMSNIEKDKKEPIEGIEQRIATAKMGQKMMRGVEQVQVIDSLVVDSLTFINYYRITPEAGRLLSHEMLPQAFEADSATIAYTPQRGDVIYMANKPNGNYDLCLSNNLLGHDWGALHSISNTLNNEYNQNYPYVLSDGQTLYFAQDGENSFGGYDIFVTMFNSERGDYMLPQNVGMPFNSPYNDYMMVIDEYLNVGWFVTDRNHIPGKLTLYIFIPNDTKRVYATDTPHLASLAQLSSIADTWAEGADYSEILEQIAAIKPEERSMRIHEFTFVVCDGRIYTHSSDFSNPEALHYYNQSRSLQRRIDERNARLDSLRAEYAQASLERKSQLENEIRQLENEILKSNESPMMYENRARRAELAFLGINIE